MTEDVIDHISRVVLEVILMVRPYLVVYKVFGNLGLSKMKVLAVNEDDAKEQLRNFMKHPLNLHKIDSYVVIEVQQTSIYD